LAIWRHVRDLPTLAERRSGSIVSIPSTSHAGTKQTA
jgi:hypothetical protein